MGDDQDPVDNWSEGLTTEASIHLIMPDRRSNPHVLRQTSGPGAPREWVLERDEVVIGRSKGADFSIDSPELSRQHIKIEKLGKEFRAVDLMSRNGVYLDGIKFHSVVLRNGDVLQIGNVSFVYYEGN